MQGFEADAAVGAQRARVALRNLGDGEVELRRVRVAQVMVEAIEYTHAAEVLRDADLAHHEPAWVAGKRLFAPLQMIEHGKHRLQDRYLIAEILGHHQTVASQCSAGQGDGRRILSVHGLQHIAIVAYAGEAVARGGDGIDMIAVVLGLQRENKLDFVRPRDGGEFDCHECRALVAGVDPDGATFAAGTARDKLRDAGRNNRSALRRIEFVSKRECAGTYPAQSLAVIAPIATVPQAMRFAALNSSYGERQRVARMECNGIRGSGLP